jgi:hypothetical protein
MSSTTRQADLFGTPQGNLFDGYATPDYTPERMAPIVRPRLAALLAEERDALRAEFRAELDRLRAAR